MPPISRKIERFECKNAAWLNSEFHVLDLQINIDKKINKKKVAQFSNLINSHR